MGTIHNWQYWDARYAFMSANGLKDPKTSIENNDRKIDTAEKHPLAASVNGTMTGN